MNATVTPDDTDLKPVEPPNEGGGIFVGETSSEDSLDEFTLRVEAVLDKHLDARLKTMEAKLDRLVMLADALEKVGKEMEKNPMIAGMISGDGFSF